MTATPPCSRGLLVYLLVTFGLAWGIMLGPVRSIGLQSGSPLVMALMVGVMFCPLLGALAARRVERAGFADAGLRWGKGRYHLIAWLLPVAFSAAAVGLTIALGLGQWDPGMSAVLEKLPEDQRESMAQFAQGFGPWFPLVALAGAMTSGVLITSVATFGEEFGWRGYLQMRLERFGVLNSMVITGLIWGVWHAPVILQGHNYPDHPVAGTLLFIPVCVALAIIFGWLRNASGSVLAPTIAHASLNSPGAGLMLLVSGYHPLVGNMLGLVGLALLGLVVAWLIATGRVR